VRSRICSARESLAGNLSDATASAVVLDQLGGYEAIGAAEQLVMRGARVTFVTTFTRFAPKLEAALISQPALKRLRRGAFSLLTAADVVAFDGTCASISIDGVGNEARVDAERLIVASPGLPDEQLRNDLARHFRVISVGEASSPGAALENAIREGHDAAMLLGLDVDQPKS
jgi:hypothetical protein